MKKYKFDLIVIAVLILAAGVSIIVINNIYNEKGNYVEITIDGELEKTLPLDEDTDYKITKNNLNNVIEIRNGKVFMKEADCPDRLCVKQGQISKNGQSIICLPHKIVVKITSDDAPKVDDRTN